MEGSYILIFVFVVIIISALTRIFGEVIITAILGAIFYLLAEITKNIFLGFNVFIDILDYLFMRFLIPAILKFSELISSNSVKGKQWCARFLVNIAFKIKEEPEFIARVLVELHKIYRIVNNTITLLDFANMVLNWFNRDQSYIKSVIDALPPQES